jgi:hypothetical protein
MRQGAWGPPPCKFGQRGFGVVRISTKDQVSGLSGPTRTKVNGGIRATGARWRSLRQAARVSMVTSGGKSISAGIQAPRRIEAHVLSLTQRTTAR